MNERVSLKKSFATIAFVCIHTQIHVQMYTCTHVHTFTLNPTNKIQIKTVKSNEYFSRVLFDVMRKVLQLLLCLNNRVTDDMDLLFVPAPATKRTNEQTNDRLNEWNEANKRMSYM